MLVFTRIYDFFGPGALVTPRPAKVVGGSPPQEDESEEDEDENKDSEEEDKDSEEEAPLAPLAAAAPLAPSAVAPMS